MGRKKQNRTETVCECGCGGTFVRRNRKPTPSRFIRGHNPALRANLTNRTVSDLMREKAKEAFDANPVMKKGPKHVNARTWQVRSPRGVTYQFRNLREFIRNNPNLFLPEDIEWVRKPDGNESCRACTGIAGISIRLKNPRTTWKGWTWFSQTEKLFNNGEDLLQRMSNTEQLARRAFYQDNVSGNEILKSEYPNGCSLNEAIAFFNSLPAEKIAICEALG